MCKLYKDTLNCTVFCYCSIE